MGGGGETLTVTLVGYALYRAHSLLACKSFDYPSEIGIFQILYSEGKTGTKEIKNLVCVVYQLQKSDFHVSFLTFVKTV